METPVYLFTGFLESGKTKFIQETLEDKRFCSGEGTLLLVCEEGIEEYAPEKFADSNLTIKVIDTVDELTEKNLLAYQKESKAKRVIIEYNGMWLLEKLYTALPKDWVLYQEMTFADANTILNYNANMRTLVFDKLTNCELVIFNRVPFETDVMPLHKLVRGVSRRADIAYEHPDGSVSPDEIEDPLPFDVNAEHIVIEDKDYALWYRDMAEQPQKYNGKTLTFTGILAVDKKMPANTAVIGRHIMTCCADDIQYCSVILTGISTGGHETGEWLSITAKYKFEYHKLYKGNGPVLSLISLTKTDAPEQKVATFY